MGRPSHGRGTELILCVFLHGGGNEWCPDGTGADSVYADTVGDLLVVETACERDDGAFAGGVVEEVGTADVGVYRGAVDDGVAGLHVREGVFGQVEVGVDVGVEGLEPLLPTPPLVHNGQMLFRAFVKDVLWEFCDTVDHVLVGCIVHDNVYGAHLLESLVD